MLEKQKQIVGNGSTAIQVNGDYYGQPSYSDIKKIFEDLLQSNFPKLQDIANSEVDKRIKELFIQLREVISDRKNNIDPTKLYDPDIQYQMCALVVNVARKGKKSNIEYLTELFCTILSKDCPDILESVAGETLHILPKIQTKHISYLSFDVLVKEVKFPNHSICDIDKTLYEINEHISECEKITQSDIRYLSLVGFINITSTGLHCPPSFIGKLDLLENLKYPVRDQRYQKFNVAFERLEQICIDNEFNNLVTFMQRMKVPGSSCSGNHQLTMAGSLIGWMNIKKYFNVDVKKIFE